VTPLHVWARRLSASLPRSASMLVATGDASCRRIWGYRVEPTAPFSSVRGLRGRRQRFDSPVHTGVVHVVVGDESQDTGGDGAGQDAFAVKVVDHRIGGPVGEDD